MFSVLIICVVHSYGKMSVAGASESKVSSLQTMAEIPYNKCVQLRDLLSGLYLVHKAVV